MKNGAGNSYAPFFECFEQAFYKAIECSGDYYSVLFFAFWKNIKT